MALNAFLFTVGWTWMESCIALYLQVDDVQSSLGSIASIQRGGIYLGRTEEGRIMSHGSNSKFVFKMCSPDQPIRFLFIPLTA